MAWSAELTSLNKSDGNIIARLRFTESGTGEIVERDLRGNNLTEQQLENFVDTVISSLEDRDSYFTTLQPLEGSLITRTPISLPTYKQLSSRELLSWAAQAGRLRRVINGRSHPDESVSSIAEAAYLLINRDNAALDLNTPEHQALVSALVIANIFTSSDETNLYNLAAN